MEFPKTLEEHRLLGSCEIFIPNYINTSNPDIAIAKELGDRVETMGLFWFLVDGKDW